MTTRLSLQRRWRGEPLIPIPRRSSVSELLPAAKMLGLAQPQLNTRRLQIGDLYPFLKHGVDFMQPFGCGILFIGSIRVSTGSGAEPKLLQTRRLALCQIEAKLDLTLTLMESTQLH